MQLIKNKEDKIPSITKTSTINIDGDDITVSKIGEYKSKSLHMYKEIEFLHNYKNTTEYHSWIEVNPGGRLCFMEYSGLCNKNNTCVNCVFDIFSTDALTTTKQCYRQHPIECLASNGCGMCTVKVEERILEDGLCYKQFSNLCMHAPSCKDCKVTDCKSDKSKPLCYKLHPDLCKKATSCKDCKVPAEVKKWSTKHCFKMFPELCKRSTCGTCKVNYIIINNKVKRGEMMKPNELGLISIANDALEELLDNERKEKDKKEAKLAKRRMNV